MNYKILTIALMFSFELLAQTPIDTDFTYQGELIFNNQLATGDYDFEVTAFDALTNGADYDAPYSVDAIPVVNGIFTLPLNFGDTTFMGTEVFLEIGVRLNGSGLPYETLTPRQKLTSSPYAIHAQFVGANAVTSSEIFDGTITTQDLANNAITSAKINASVVGTTQINSAQVQRRISGNCVAGQFISSVNEDGSVVCNVDDTGSTSVISADIVDGTIQMVDLANNIINNAKLVDNVVTASKISPDAVTAAAIANGAVGSSEIANDSIGKTHINSLEIQTRVDGTCGSAEFVKSVNQDGTVNCNTDNAGITSVTSAEIVNGTIAAVDIGFEVIEKDNMKNAAVSEAKIANNAVGLTKIKTNEVQQRVVSTCDEGFYLRGINEDGSVICQQLPLGFKNNLASLGVSVSFSIAIMPVNGFPIISYYDSFAQDLHVYECTNLICSTGVVRSLDAVGDVGHFNSIAIMPVTGQPIISYIDATNDDLKVYRCSTFNCSSGSSIKLDDVGSGGLNSSIAIGVTGLPIISYIDSTNDSLKIWSCFNSSCTSGNDFILDSSAVVNNSTSIVIRPSTGFPLISYKGNNNLRVFDCADTFCSSGNSIVLDSSANVGGFSDLVLTFDRPQISYYDQTNRDLKLYVCDNINCTVGTSILLDSIGEVGKFTSIAYNSADKTSIISYYDESNQSLKIYNCDNNECSIGSSKTLDDTRFSGFVTSITINNLNRPQIVYTSALSGLHIYSCHDSECMQ